MLEIHARIDDLVDLQELLDSGRYPYFGLWWRVDGVDFPEENWGDFAMTLMALWTDNAGALANGVSIGEFIFMDGSGRIVANRVKRSEVLRLRAVWNDRTVHEWTCNDRDIAAALLLAVRQAMVGFGGLRNAEGYMDWLRSLEHQLLTYA